MKTLLTLLLLLLANCCISQLKYINDTTITLSVPYKPAQVALIKGGIQVASSQIDNTTKMIYKDLDAGLYSIRISGSGKPREIKDAILVQDGHLFVFDINVGGPCLYDHPANYIPRCPENHTDHIVTIVYGLFINTTPASNQKPRSRKKASKKEDAVHYGGCVTTGCDPGFYCNIHYKQF